jgi:hypothetical protein
MAAASAFLVALLGTPYEPQTEGKLLFLEDVNAKPYQIDRMLWQLRQAGKLDGVKGIVFGEMLDCTSPGAAPELLDEVILRVFDDFQGRSPSACAAAMSRAPMSRSPLASRLNCTPPTWLQPSCACWKPAVSNDGITRRYARGTFT